MGRSCFFPYDIRNGHLARIKGAPLTVLAALTTFADKDTGEAFPSKKALCEATGYGSHHTIDDAVDVLVAEGLLETIERGRTESPIYRLLPSIWWRSASATAESAKEGVALAESAEATAESAEATAESAEALRQKVPKALAESANERTPSNVTEGQGPKAPPIVPPRTKKQPAVHPDAASIYELYPRKEARGAALAAIGKHLRELSNGKRNLEDPVGWLKERVHRYATSPDVLRKLAAGEKNYIPHCSTWMNDQRYDDPIDDTRPGQVAWPAQRQPKGMSTLFACQELLDDLEQEDGRK